MKKILGVDVGTASIGWAYVWEADNVEESKIKAGVRIIPLDSEQRDNFASGAAVTINAERRRYRGMRKNLDRYQLRRENLIDFFLSKKWVASREEALKSNASVFDLRAKAVTEKISLAELAQVILRLNKNRGFKSNRLADRGEEESTEYKAAIAGRDAELKKQGLTIGQLFIKERDEWVQNQTGPEPHFESRTYSRSSVVDEFEAIWSCQSQHHAEVCEADRAHVRDHLLFYQRRLKSQKHLIGRCVLEPRRRVAPKSSPVYQAFRVWQDIKNIRVMGELGRSRRLTYDEQLVLVKELEHGKRLTDKRIKALLKLSAPEMVNMELLPNLFEARLRPILADLENVEELLNIDLTLAGDAFDKQPVMRLWHLLYATESEEALEQALRKMIPEASDETIGKLLMLRLPQDHGQVSHKAMRKMLGHLRSEECEGYAHAAELAGYRHSQHETKSEREARELLDSLPEIKRNELRNPAVEKVLNQLVNLFNALLADPEFGRPDEIHIELARELKQPAKARKRASLRMRDNEKERNRVRDLLSEEFPGKRITRNDVLRYQLAEECGFFSLYTGKSISMAKLFTADYEIEHIIPQSRVFDDSYLNKTICERSVNLQKGSLTAMEYMEELGADAVKNYENRLKRAEKTLPKAKLDRLRWVNEDIPNDFINRQLNETQYIAREAYTRAGRIAKDVVPVAGNVTSYLRHIWGLENVLEELTLPRYKAQGLSRTIEWTHPDGKKEKKEVPVDWSKRTDHRHHAMDAITVALTTRGHVQFLNTLNERKGEVGVGLKQVKSAEGRTKHLKPRIGKDLARKLAKDALSEIIISRKPGKRGTVWSRYRNHSKSGEVLKKHRIPRGQLHKETVYGVILQYVKGRTKLAKLDEDLTLIVDVRLREAIRARLEADQLPPKKAFTAARLKKNPLLMDGQVVEEVQCFERIVTQKVPVGPGLKVSEVIDSKVRSVLEARLEAHGGKAAKAFVNLEEDPIWMDEDRKQQLRKVNVRAKLNALVPLREEDGQPKDFVNLRNNHHLALYQTEDGTLVPRIVSFLEVVQREVSGEPAIRSVDELGRPLVSTLASDEYVVFDLEVEDADELLKMKRSDLAPHVYRVQKMSYGNVAKQTGVDVYFRHHTEATIQVESHLAFRRIKSLQRMPQWKIRLNVLGEIEQAVPLIPKSE